MTPGRSCGGADCAAAVLRVCCRCADRAAGCGGADRAAAVLRRCGGGAA